MIALKQSSLTSLLVGAGAAMVAMTSIATITVPGLLNWSEADLLHSFLLMIGCSSTATIYVFSHLHAELKRREKEAISEARTDPLTSLPNRKAAVETLRRKINQFNATGNVSCLVFLDLNNFKNINDTLGHDVGDELLTKVAQRLKEHLKTNKIFRLGGDEFALILSNCTVLNAMNICRNLHHRIAGTYSFGETYAGVGCSFGIAQVGTDLSASELMRRADFAMYKAKKNRTFVEVFDDKMHQEVTRRSQLSDGLRVALQSGAGITLKYQPILSSERFPNERRVVALEVYFRWYFEPLGAIPPREAIQIARLTQQIDRLSLFVAGKAGELISRLPNTKLSLNVDAAQVLDTRFSEALEELLTGVGLPNSAFQLEFDEAEVVSYSTRIAPVMRGLAESGFSIAIDNYGTRTSSLTDLKSFGVSALKLDGSILRNARETGNIAIMRAKVHLASTLGMSVTCKDIKDQEDESIALQAGCDFLQGFKYGRPDYAETFLVASSQDLENGNSQAMSVGG